MGKISVAGLGVEPSLRDYEPHVHRTLSRAIGCSSAFTKRTMTV